MDNRAILSKKQIQLTSFGALVVSLILALFFFKTTIYPTENGKPKFSQDFIAFYAASSLSKKGSPELIYNRNLLLEEEREIAPKTSNIPWFYPPTYLLVVEPLSLLDYTSSRIIFYIIGFFVYILACLKWVKSKGEILIAVAFAPTLVNFAFGQNGLYTASFMILALFYLKNKPALSGFFIALLAIKPHLALLIPLALLAGKKRIAFLWSTFFTSLFVAITLFKYGSDIWLTFFNNISEASNNIESKKLALSYMTSIASNLIILDVAPKYAHALQIIFAIPFIIVMLKAWRSTQGIEIKGASLSLATVMTSPYIFDYDLSWLIITIGLLSLHASKNGWLKGESLILCIAWALPMIDFICVLAHSKSWFPYNLWLPMNFALLWIIYRRLANSHRSSASLNMRT